MTLKIYVDRLSQPSRAILIFSKANKIEFEEVKMELAKGDHRKPEFKEINTMGQVPAIVDGDFKLFESHAILEYLACAHPSVADHWYPSDLHKRAKIHSVLDWHHSNLRRGAAPYMLHTVLAPVLGIPQSPSAAAEAEKLLIKSLSTIETFWLQPNGKFLVGCSQPSIADISLVCEIMQLELAEAEDRNRVLGPFKKVLQWMEDTRIATSPYLDEVHGLLFQLKPKFHKKPIGAISEETGSSIQAMLSSNL